MKKPLFMLVALAAVMSFASCDDYETYGEKKERERDAISEYIRSEKINVIDDSRFHAQGDSTSVEKNEFVYLPNSGVYMQIVRKGAGEKLEENKQVNLICRYMEYNIFDKAVQSRNDYNPRNYDKMSVTRTGSQYTASFSSGVMFSTYGASVPAGWLVPLQYIRVGRQTTPADEIAKVRLIVPHTQGHSYATSSVYPCYYEITYQREK
ncbi:MULTISPECIES: DUF4827 domain-containing protein [unclassified Prevotella]|jgi:hypothetical protein|uniref:DUF4827 domain-containing protein n=1 Tax=unclassified Prevotella TaxID=2638335 RepID=UPI000CE9B9D5|nr:MULTISPECIES: DUF4827 domain-containing protein [unclassified Prevotella]MCX4292537.1 DUF4827 domain-containing protein [Prevotella sp.]NPD53628.1 DUF4827 domain-containing protein [Prevotella sp. PTAC]